MRCRSMKPTSRGQRERTSRNSSGCNRLHSEIGMPITINAPKLLRLQREYFLNCHLSSMQDALRHASVSGGRGSTRSTDWPPAVLLPVRGYRCRDFSGFSPQARPCRSCDRSGGAASRSRQPAAHGGDGSRWQRRRERGCALREVRRTHQRSTSEEAAGSGAGGRGAVAAGSAGPEKSSAQAGCGRTGPCRCSWKSVERDRRAAIDISNHSGEKQS